MDLKAFLQLSCQLVDKQKAIIKIQGYEVTIEITSLGWQISTPICKRGVVPLSLLNSVALSRFSIFEKQGIFLKRDHQTGSLVLLKKTKALNDYEDFEKVLSIYIKFCDQWKELIDDEYISETLFAFKEG